MTVRDLLRLNLLVFVVYAVIGTLTLLVGQYSGLASPVWPAAGLAFAAIYVWGWRLLPAVLLGSLASNALTLVREGTVTQTSLFVAVVIALGAALQALIGARLVTAAVGRRASLTRGGEILAFLLLAAVVGSVVNASVATVTQVAFGLVSADQALLVWVTWWVGDAIGVVVFGPLALMLIPSQREVWQGRRWRVAIPSLTAVVLFVAFFVQAENQSANEMRLRTEQLANSAAIELERNVARHQEVLEGLSSFFESSEEVNRDEFASYTASALRRFPNLQALSWNPIVTADELDAFEQRIRADGEFPDFTVTERDAQGELVPVAPRDDYVVVEYIEPLATNEAAIGFDINSNPIRQQAINKAGSLGVPAATAPIDLVQESGTQKGMLALVPVYERNTLDEREGQVDRLLGFAVGVYRLDDLLTDTFAGPVWASTEIHLVDVTNPDDSREISTREALKTPTVDQTQKIVNSASSDRFSVFGRTWQVEVVPTSGPLANPGQAMAPSLEFVGLLVILLVQAFVLLVTGTERQAWRHAESSEQEANTDHLTGLSNRRAFLRNLELVRQRSKMDGTGDSLLFMDLDRFKSVNDQGGHDAGDRMLQAVARVLTANVRSRDTVARIGGDEFAVVLNNCGTERAMEIAQKLVAEVNALRVTSDHGELSVGLSVGVVSFSSGDDLSVDELLRRADDASYDIKHAGGGALLYGTSAGSDV